MKYLNKIKKIVIVLLIVSIIISVFAYTHGGRALFNTFSTGWDMMIECIVPSVIMFVGIVQSINLSIIWYILCILDKEVMPLY